MGELQFAFLVDQGLRADDDLLDVACGSLRGGVHFVRYLKPGRYFGLDIDEALLAAGRGELSAAGLDPAAVALVADDRFRFERFGRTFRWALAQSLFTHLPFNAIIRCLGEIEPVLEEGGRFYATFFANPGPRLRTEELRVADDVVASLDADPFFYPPDIFRWAVEGSRLSCDLIGEWGHPRNQQMLVFTKR